MSPLPASIHTVAQAREIDRQAIEGGIASYVLMTRAAEAALALLRERWPTAQRIVVVCGSGNNGGDGYVLARLARAARLDAEVIALADPASLEGDARRAFKDFNATGAVAREWSEDCLDGAHVVVDAIFGIGLSRPVEGLPAAAIQAMNRGTTPVFSLDVPSGLNGDTGHVMGVAVHASCTLAFVGLKLGFYLGDGPDHTGEVRFDGLAIPPDVVTKVGSVATRLDPALLARLLPRRRRIAHKGEHGHVLVIGGGPGMAGAARLSGEAALRCGAGLVTIATHPDNVAAIVPGRPELMCRGCGSPTELEPLLSRADVLALGPGLGQDEWATGMYQAALAAGKPAVVDADALNLLSRAPRAESQWILTPHPGEAARLLGVSTPLIQAHRLESARALASRYGGVIVLKGAGTLVVAGDDPPSICDAGNPGMASAGMGDVLTGTIAAIAAQVGDLPAAARAGVLAHAMAGDLAARRGERGLIASDLFAHLQTCVNPTA